MLLSFILVFFIDFNILTFIFFLALLDLKDFFFQNFFFPFKSLKFWQSFYYLFRFSLIFHMSPRRKMLNFCHIIFLPWRVKVCLFCFVFCFSFFRFFYELRFGIVVGCIYQIKFIRVSHAPRIKLVKTKRTFYCIHVSFKRLKIYTSNYLKI